MHQDPFIQAAARAPEVPEPAQRVEEILGFARQAFVEKGFDGASMKDLARAVGMSAGNFYRYFPCKAAIVEALIARDLQEVEDSFLAIAASSDPLAALKAELRREACVKCTDADTLWSEIFATGARKPEVAAILRGMEDGIVLRVAHVMGLAAGLDEGEAWRRFEVDARAVFLVLHGLMSSALPGVPRDSAVVDLVMRAVDRIMDDAVNAAKDA